MASLAEIEDHRRSVQALITLAQRDLVEFWRALGQADAMDASRAVRAVLPEIVDAYGQAAGELSATWYEDLRDASPAPGTYAARTADLPPTEQVEALARWGVGPLFGAAPDATLALSLLSGGMQRLVSGVDRATIAENADLDPGRPVWSRHASANACAFCRLLATRGAVYGSEESASGVVGRKGVARGLRDIGTRYHDHCHCTAVVTWPGQDVERAPYTADWDAAYTQARRNSGGDLTVILADMRRTLGAA